MSENWHDLISYHKTLLADTRRCKSFYKALKRSINPESRVLDIGTGTGIWAVAAAKLGAKRIVAIEGNPGLETIIRGTLRENAVEDKVELIIGRSWETELDDRFDIVISETIGDLAFEEGIVHTMIDAKKRFLAKGGELIPQKLSIVAAPCFVSDGLQQSKSFPVTFAYLTSLSRNLSYRLGERQRAQILARPRKIFSVDLTSVASEPDYKGMTGKWSLHNISQANAFVAWAKSELIPGVTLDTWDCPSWSPLVYSFEPFEAGKGRIQFDLSLNVQQSFWTVKANVDGQAISRSYSPTFGLMKLQFDSQANQ